MKTQTRRLATTFIILLLAVIVSCNLFTSVADDTDDTAVNKGRTYTINIAPQFSGRAAFPSMPSSAYGYTGFLVLTTASANTVLSYSQATTSSLTFAITGYIKTTDTFTLYVYAYEETPYSNLNFSSLSVTSTSKLSAYSSITESAFASGIVSTINGSDFYDSSTLSLSMTLCPINSGSGTSAVSLKVSFPLKPNDIEITKVIYSFYKSASASIAGQTVTSFTTYTTGDTVTLPITANSIPVGSDYFLLIQFYSTLNSSYSLIKQACIPLNVWQGLTTNKWELSDGTLSDTYTLSKADFSSYNTDPAAINAYFINSAGERSPVSFYGSIQNQVIDTTPVSISASSTSYYATITPEGSQKLYFDVQLSMPGQSFTLSNTVQYSSSSILENNMQTNFTRQDTEGVSYNTGTNYIKLYPGMNSFTLTIYASDRSTSTTYNLCFTNPYYYVSTSGSDTLSTSSGTPTAGTGREDMPYATANKALTEIQFCNQKRRASYSGDTVKYCCTIDGEISSTAEAAVSGYTIDLTIKGANSNSATDGIKNTSTGSRILNLSGASLSNLVIKDLHFTGGSFASGNGGALCIMSFTSTTLTNVIIGDTASSQAPTTTNDASNYCSGNGGGIFISGTAYLNSTTISNNYATAAGGGIYCAGTLYLNSTTLQNNCAVTNGGGIYSTGVLYIQDGSQISSNKAVNGGGVYETSKLTLSDGVISNNQCTSCGGGIYTTGMLVMSGGSVQNNTIINTTAGDICSGGGIYSNVKGNSLSCSLTITGGTISGNSITQTAAGDATCYGAGIYSDPYNISGTISTVEIYGNTISATTTDAAGKAIAGGAGISLYNTASSNTNAITISSGKIYSNTCTAKANNSTSTASSATASGGGIYGNAKINMTGGEVYANKAVATSDAKAGATASAYGGGISIAMGNSSFTGGTVSGNSASATTTGSATTASCGNGVYCPTSLSVTIGGTLYVNGNNDFYIDNSGYTANNSSAVTIDTVTGTTPAAIFTPKDYTAALVSFSTNTIRTANLSKFAVSPNGSQRYALNEYAFTNDTSGKWAIATSISTTQYTITNAASWETAASAIGGTTSPTVFTVTFGEGSAVDLSSGVTTAMTIPSGVTVIASSGTAAATTVTLPSAPSFTPFVVSSGGSLALTTDNDTNALTLTGADVIRSAPLISTSGSLTLGKNLTITGYKDYQYVSLLSEIKDGETKTCGAVVINASGSCIVSGTTFQSTSDNPQTAKTCGRAIYLADTTSMLTINSGTFNHLFANYGAAIYAKAGTVRIYDAQFGNSTDSTGMTLKAYQDGGAIYMEDGSLTISGGMFSGNATYPIQTNTGNGGIICMAKGACTISGGTLTRGSASLGGAVYMGGGTFTMTGGTLGDHSATAAAKYTVSTDTTYANLAGCGGGLYLAAGTTGTISGTSCIAYNVAGPTWNSKTEGGGVYIETGATLTITQDSSSAPIIRYNICRALLPADTPSGGGVYCDGTLTMKSGKLITNGLSADLSQKCYGSGIYVSANGSCTLDSVTCNSITYKPTIQENTGASYGGGIYCAGTGTMNNGTIIGNEASDSGGGVFVDSQTTFTQNAGSITLNSSASYGGGVYVNASASNPGTYTMHGGEIDANEATTQGGGAYILGSFTMDGGKISSNESSDIGGGVYIAKTTDVSGNFSMKLNSDGTTSGSIESNTATNKGGGIYTTSGVTISAGTLKENASKFGCGIYLAGGTMNMSGGLVTSNRWGPNTGNGKGIYYDTGTLQLSSTATIDDFVYLPTSSSFITVAGTLTPLSNYQYSIILDLVISSTGWKTGDAVVNPATEYSLIEDDIDCIKLNTPTTGYKIDESGTLQTAE